MGNSNTVRKPVLYKKGPATIELYSDDNILTTGYVGRSLVGTFMSDLIDGDTQGYLNTRSQLSEVKYILDKDINISDLQQRKIPEILQYSPSDLKRRFNITRGSAIFDLDLITDSSDSNPTTDEIDALKALYRGGRIPPVLVIYDLESNPVGKIVWFKNSFCQIRKQTNKSKVQNPIGALNLTNQSNALAGNLKKLPIVVGPLIYQMLKTENTDMQRMHESKNPIILNEDFFVVKYLNEREAFGVESSIYSYNETFNEEDTVVCYWILALFEVNNLNIIFREKNSHIERS